MSNKELACRALTPHPSAGRRSRFENLTATLPSSDVRKAELKVGCFVTVTPGGILKLPQHATTSLIVQNAMVAKTKDWSVRQMVKVCQSIQNHLLQPSFEWQWLLARNLGVAPCRKSHLSQVVAWSSNVLQESFSQAWFHCMNTTFCWWRNNPSYHSCSLYTIYTPSWYPLWYPLHIPLISTNPPRATCKVTDEGWFSMSLAWVILAVNHPMLANPILIRAH